MSLEQYLDRIATALEILAGKAVPVPTPATASAAEPQARKRRTNAEIAADKAKEPAAEAVAVESVSSDEADAEPAPKVITVADVSNAIVAGIKAGLRDQVKAVLTKYGATNASTVKPKDIVKVIAELTELAEVAS